MSHTIVTCQSCPNEVAMAEPFDGAPVTCADHDRPVGRLNFSEHVVAIDDEQLAYYEALADESERQYAASFDNLFIESDTLLDEELEYRLDVATDVLESVGIPVDHGYLRLAIAEAIETLHDEEVYEDTRYDCED